MTEWNATEYARLSGLQRAMAEEVLALLPLEGAKSILDVGCGNGKVTAEIAARAPGARVVGVDASEAMIDFAAQHFAGEQWRNLHFQVADAQDLPFDEEFGLVVSLNALHWVPDQAKALRSIHSAMKPDGVAHLRLVPAGKRKSLEDVIEETRRSPRWAPYFAGFHDPYLHLAPEAYASLAERNGFRVQSVEAGDRTWDFGSRAAFQEFGSVTFIAWTQHIRPDQRPAFVADVLDRYRSVACEAPGEENCFKFYQMDVALKRA